MKLLIVLCAVIAVAVASAYGDNNYQQPNVGYVEQYDSFNPFYKTHDRRHGRHGRHGRHHRRHRDSSDSSDSSSDSRSSSSSGSHSYERDDYYRHRMQYPIPSYGNVANEAPAATAYGSPVNDAPAPAPYGVNTFGRK